MLYIEERKKLLLYGQNKEKGEDRRMNKRQEALMHRAWKLLEEIREVRSLLKAKKEEKNEENKE